MCRNMDCSGEHIFEIDQAILDKTVKCSKRGCLSGKDVICPVQNALDLDIIFVDFDHRNDICRYCMPYGDGFMCLCPTRQEIFHKYRK